MNVLTKLSSRKSVAKRLFDETFMQQILGHNVTRNIKFTDSYSTKNKKQKK